MENKDIIIYLIEQEMKYHQLIFGLERLGFIYEDNTISMLEVIQPLMGIENNGKGLFPSISDKLADTYLSWMDKAMVKEIGQSIDDEAAKCYEEIVKIVKREGSLL